MKKGPMLVICFLFYCLGFSQHMPYINYTTHNGLPQIQVRELFQDSKGYIWIGTKGGIAKFNGETFKEYLRNEYITFIGEEPDGDVMVMSRKGLYRYHSGQMKLVTPLDSPFLPVFGNQRIWLYNHQEIREFTKDSLSNTYKPLTVDNDSINAVVFTRDGELLFSTRKTKSVFRLKQEGVLKIFTLESGVVQVGTFSNGALFYAVIYQESFRYFDPVNNTEYFSYTLKNNTIGDVEITSLPVDHFILQQDFQYHILDSVTLCTTTPEFPFIKSPWPVILDRDGNYWVGSDNGLYQVNNGPFRIYPREFLNDIWTLVKGRDGYLYGAVYQKGLFQIDPVNQSKTELVCLDKSGNKVTDYYYGASADKNGNLYFPTHYGTVVYNYRNLKLLETGVSLISTFDPFSNRIIIGQQHGIAFVNETGLVETFTDSTRQFVNINPASFEFNPDGDIWVGTWNTLAKFSRAKKRFFAASDLFPTAPKGGVVSMTSDYMGNIWMGGVDGLWLFDVKQKEFERVNQNLINSYVSSVFSPDSTLLLVGTSYEIYAISLQDFYRKQQPETKTFNFRNGFVAEETSQNGFLFDGGKVYIPSTTYTSVLDLKKIAFIPDFYDVKIISVNGKEIENSGKGSSSIIEPIVESRLEIIFEPVGFGLPTQSRFCFKLEGFDSEWSDWGLQTQAIYNGLSSGKYRFRVMALNSSLLENKVPKEAIIGIEINLPFYKEPDFYKYVFFLFFCLTAISVFLTFIWLRAKFRISKREKKIRLLEVATLQAQLNPHFIFNSLSTVQNLVSKNDAEEANRYLVKFSRLIRNYMESSIKTSQLQAGDNSSDVLIRDEIETLRMYTELEIVKFPEGKISCKISVENDAVLNRTIPPMIIQPFVENAIKHGLAPKDAPGLVEIGFYEKPWGAQCIIKDNGLGRKKSEELTRNSIRLYKSRGMELVRKRVEILGELGIKLEIKIEDPTEGGTMVFINFYD